MIREEKGNSASPFQIRPGRSPEERSRQSFIGIIVKDRLWDRVGARLAQGQRETKHISQQSVKITVRKLISFKIKGNIV